jgi:hypothetical protein
VTYPTHLTHLPYLPHPHTGKTTWDPSL